jgi:hypothetical protein
MPKLTKSCQCSMCHMPMMAGEEFEWRQKTFTRHASNSGRDLKTKKWLPRHALEVGCMGPDWHAVGGGYDKHAAKFR